MWGLVLRFGGRLLGGASQAVLGDTASKLIDRFAALKDASTEVERAEIEKEIEQLRLIHDLQKPSSTWRWSPMILGQYLIVLPFGLWWAAVFIVSVVRPYLVEGKISVDNVPPHLFDMAVWLIPLVIVGTVLDRTGRK